MIRELLAEIIYMQYRFRAPEHQKKYLPKRFSDYEDYHSTYGTAPGDAYDTENGPIVITDITGPPRINATVEYIELEKDLERQMGLVAFYNMTGAAHMASE
jgi:hypothetical protein